MRIPGTLLVIWLVSPCPMKPAPIMPTRIGRPSRSRSRSTVSTRIMTAACRPRTVGQTLIRSFSSASTSSSIFQAASFSEISPTGNGHSSPSRGSS